MNHEPFSGQDPKRYYDDLSLEAKVIRHLRVVEDPVIQLARRELKFLAPNVIQFPISYPQPPKEAA